MIKLSGLLLIISAPLAGCTRSASERGTSDSSAPTTPAVASPSAPATGTQTKTGAAGCPRTGQWALCNVESRLTQSGFVVRPVSGDAPRRAGFRVKPAVYTLGRSRLEVFIYPSESELAADVAKIDTATAAPRGVPNPWPYFSPTFVRSGNLAAVFLTENGTQAERLTNALAAGAPQP